MARKEYKIKTAILGGGLTGLTSGYFVKPKRNRFEILEKEKESEG